MKVAIKDIVPNPFRHIKRYPINREKVDALKRSIKSTDFWDNLLARKASNGSDKFEIAYGHHRLKALQELHVDEIELTVRKLDNDRMAKIMASENMEEWGHSSAIEQETVRAVVEGFAAGDLHLPPVKIRDGDRGSGTIRTAPSFIPGRIVSPREETIYTAATLAEYLDWKPYKVESALAALASIEEGLLEERDFEKLSSKQAETVVRETKRVAKTTGDTKKAKAIGKRLTAGFRKATGKKIAADGSLRDLQDVTIHSAKRIAEEMSGGTTTSPKRPNLDKFVRAITVGLADILTERDGREQKLDALVKFKDDLTGEQRRGLINCLRSLAKRAESYANKLDTIKRIK